MNRDDLLAVLCKLNNTYSRDFETIKSEIVFELEGRKYEIEYKKIKGNLINFQATYIEALDNENN
jgi:hypothetical protein